MLLQSWLQKCCNATLSHVAFCTPRSRGFNKRAPSLPSSLQRDAMYRCERLLRRPPRAQRELAPRGVDWGEEGGDDDAAAPPRRSLHAAMDCRHFQILRYCIICMRSSNFRPQCFDDVDRFLLLSAVFTPFSFFLSKWFRRRDMLNDATAESDR